jgi:hypothetical protein
MNLVEVDEFYDMKEEQKLCEETTAGRYVNYCHIHRVKIHITVLCVRQCVAWYVFVGNHLPDDTSEMRTPQSRN